VTSSRALLAGLALAALAGASHLARSQGSGSGPAAPAPPAATAAGSAGAAPRLPPALTGAPGDRADEGADGDAASAAARAPATAPADPAARRAWLEAQLAAAVAARPALAAARVAYAAMDLVTGAALAARDGDAGLSIASNAKLLTSVAALRGLGAGFRWRTTVHAAAPDATGTVAGDLYLRGRGDPTLTEAALRRLAAAVAARGVRAVSGRLAIDAGYFDDTTEPPHFDEQPRESAAFRAPVASLGVERGTVTIAVVGAPGGTGARVTLEPASAYARLGRVDVATVDRGRTRLRVDARARREGIEVDVSGQLRIGDGADRWELRRRVDDPARHAAEVLRRALEAEGVRIAQRGLARGAPPRSAVVLAQHDSPPLADVLRAVNKHSDNHVAETLLKTLGAEARAAASASPAPATWADGVAALRAQLAAVGLTGTYRSDNGSGLFGSSAVSARQLVALLAAAHRDFRIGPDLLASLPIGGHDGTLARRWIGRPAMGRVRAKTGSLERVVTLAGYVGVDGGHLIAFAILVNEIPTGQRPAARALADDIVDALAAYLGAA
jgi:D-alanyl-D-alanine carboxypeptidase/D-alanyl-D-alanine-endopeptidase (penicillin-binding protein 4)